MICSNIPGNNDIVSHNKTGLLFETKNHHDLVEKIKFALDNKTIVEAYALSLLNEITELYERQKVHESILNSYNHLLTTNGTEQK